MAYYVGDIPVEDLVIVPARNDEDLNLDPFEPAAEVTFTGPDGTPVPAEFVATVDADAGQVVVEWPDSSVMADPGVYTLRLVLVTGDNHRERLQPIYLVAQDDTSGWYTLDGAREDWGDAPSSDSRLYQLLELARERVSAYPYPGCLGSDPIPTRYKAGQLMQARNLWNAGVVDAGTGAAGDDSTFQLRPWPLDWMIKQTLSPKSAIPVVG